MVDFKTRLIQAMKHAGKDEHALAAHLKVTYQAVKKLTDGGSKSMSAENCAKTARYLGVDHFWLATGDGDMVHNDTPTVVEIWPFPGINPDEYNSLDAAARTHFQVYAAELLKDLKSNQGKRHGAVIAPPNSTLRIAGQELVKGAKVAKVSR